MKLISNKYVSNNMNMYYTSLLSNPIKTIDSLSKFTTPGIPLIIIIIIIDSGGEDSKKIISKCINSRREREKKKVYIHV